MVKEPMSVTSQPRQHLRTLGAAALGTALGWLIVSLAGFEGSTGSRLTFAAMFLVFYAIFSRIEVKPSNHTVIILGAFTALGVMALAFLLLYVLQA